MRPIRQPGAMAVGAQLEPNFAALVNRLVAFAINHDHALAVNFDLIFDALADKQCSLDSPAEHSWRHRPCRRRLDLDIFGAYSDKDRCARPDSLRIITAPEHDAIGGALEGNCHLAGG